MSNNKMIAMILAGGRGTRLYDLTEKVAKPAVPFGGKYRIIDFALSNCSNSNINTVGVLTQYESIQLHFYLSHDYWGFDAQDSGIYILPPREKTEGFGLYRGTADAIGQNIDFIDQTGAEYVLILSGDHIYKMNYDKMLQKHIENKADASIAVISVPIEEASRFGIMNTDKHDRIIEFEEKPKNPKSNLASMGIYIFNWQLLKKALLSDAKKEKSNYDFGKDIIPGLLNSGKRVFAYRFDGYWKDVGTVTSLWEANMDLIKLDSDLNLSDPGWRIYGENKPSLPQFVGPKASIKDSLINQGTIIEGTVEHSVLFDGSKIEEGATVVDSVIFPGAVIKKGAKVTRCIVDENIVVGNNVVIGKVSDKEITLVAKNMKGGKK